MTKVQRQCIPVPMVNSQILWDFPQSHTGGIGFVVNGRFLFVVTGEFLFVVIGGFEVLVIGRFQVVATGNFEVIAILVF